MNFKRTLLIAALPLAFLAQAAHALELKIADIHPKGYPTAVSYTHLTLPTICSV